MIKIEKVKKSFGDIKAVKNLSFKVRKGEVVGLLGPNGAGKTTTMRMIVGYLFPDSGRILIKGGNMKDNPEKIRQMIGYMPENNPIYKDMLVEELLKFALETHGVQKSKWGKKIKRVVRSTGIEKVYYRKIGELSKGFKQRVGLAQALVHEPEILILDEPTEGLDPNQRTEIRKLIKKVGQEKTVILSTHVMQEVSAMCDRAIIINEGKLIIDGNPEELSAGQSNKIFLTIEGRDIRKDLSLIKSVEKIDLLDPRKGQGVEIKNYKILYDGDVNLFEKISEIIIKNNLIIYELRKESVSLEEVFQKVTNT